jgi:hypothetical protein
LANLDKTKKKIGLDKMDDRSRKAMFQKFVDGGGKVIDEDQKDPSSKKKIIDRSSPLVGGTKGKSPSETNLNLRIPTFREEEGDMDSFIARLSVQFKCWVGGVSSFSSSPSILPKGLTAIHLDGRESIMALQGAATELLGSRSFGDKVTRDLDFISPIHIELILICKKIFDSSEFNTIGEKANSNSPIKTKDIIQPIKSIFKKLYILYSQQDTLRKSFMMGYDSMIKLDARPNTVYQSQKKRLPKLIKKLFNEVFETLYLIIIKHENRNIPMFSLTMENILGIKIEDFPGSRRVGAKNFEPVVTQEEEQKKAEELIDEIDKEIEDEEEEILLTKEEEVGVRLMKSLEPIKLRSQYDPKNEFAGIPNQDKALLTFFFYREFEEEYSFVLTNKKIKINDIIEIGNKINFQEKSNDIFESTKPIYDTIKSYIIACKDLREFRATPVTNYIEASKKTSALEAKKGTISKNLRTYVQIFMDKTKDLLKIYIEDMKAGNRIIGNQDEVFTFDGNSSRKKLHKKLIKECIFESYCYAYTLAKRIEKGDLFGGISDLNQEEYGKAFFVTEKIETIEEGIEVDSLSEEPETDKES